MDSKLVVKNIIQTLLQGRYFSLRKEIIKGLQHSTINPKLFSESLTSSLAYSRLDCDALVEELREKAISGQNGDVAAKKYAARIETVAKYLNEIKKDYTIQDVLNNLDKCPLFNDASGNVDPELEPLKNYFKTSLEALEPADTDSAIACILSSIVRAKVSGEFDSEDLSEYEKIMEPLVIAMIEDKGKGKHNYGHGDLGVGDLKAQVIAMTNKALEKAGGDKDGATKYFHDLALITLVSAIPTKSEDIPTGITNETNSPMFYLDDNGTARRFIGNATYIADEDKRICDLLAQGDKDGYFSAMRRIQGILSPRTFDAKTGAINTAFSNNEKLTQELLSILFIADGLGLELSENAIFAISNPLNKELHTIEDDAALQETIVKALELAKEILKTEKGIDYTAEISHDGGTTFRVPGSEPVGEDEAARNRVRMRTAKPNSKVTVSTSLIKLTQDAISALRNDAYDTAKKKEAALKLKLSDQKAAEQKREKELAAAEAATDPKEKGNAKRRASAADKKAEKAGTEAVAAKQEQEKADALGKVLDDFLTGIKDNKTFISAIISHKTKVPGLKGNTNTIDELKALAAALKEVLEELKIDAASMDKDAWDALLSDKKIADLVAEKVKTIVESMPQTREELETRASSRLNHEEHQSE